MVFYVDDIADIALAGPDSTDTVSLNTTLAALRSRTAAFADASRLLNFNAKLTFGQAQTDPEVKAWLLIELGMEAYDYLYIYPDPERPTQLTGDEIWVEGRATVDRYYIPLVADLTSTTGRVGVTLDLPAKLCNILTLTAVCWDLTGGVTISDIIVDYRTDGDVLNPVIIQTRPPSALSDSGAIGREGDVWYVIED